MARALVVNQGDKFGLWTIKHEANRRPRNGGLSVRVFSCQCQCGTEKELTLEVLKSGKSKSCGCKTQEWLNPARTKHNLYYHRLYTILQDMRRRCEDPKRDAFRYYGARGIKVCNEWKGDSGVINFVHWAKANGYQDDLTIDRIDNDGDYEPGNCRWTTMLVNSNNSRKNIKILNNGEIKSFADCWRSGGKIFGYQKSLRRYHQGLSINKALKP